MCGGVSPSCYYLYSSLVYQFHSYLWIHGLSMYVSGSIINLFISFRLYFIGIALSGVFSVTFSIVFAYVADCTAENERSYSYGLVCYSRNYNRLYLLHGNSIVWYTCVMLVAMVYDIHCRYTEYMYC